MEREYFNITYSLLQIKWLGEAFLRTAFIMDGADKASFKAVTRIMLDLEFYRFHCPNVLKGLVRWSLTGYFEVLVLISQYY